MANLGLMLGGVAAGLQSEQDLGLQRRALDMEQKRIDLDLRGQAQSAIKSTMELASGVIEGYKSTQLDVGGIDLYADAIASIESAGSGGYQAIGPTTKTGDRAYGKFQVMGANIPAWTQEVFGKSMSPQEFLANPAAQDAVFKAKFGQYVEQTGSTADAASMWFTGKQLAEGGALADLNGVTGLEYVRRFMQATKEVPVRKIAAGVKPFIDEIRSLGQKAGIDTTDIEKQVQAMVLSTPTALDKALGEGRADAMKKIAEAETLVQSAGLTGDAANQAVIGQLFPGDKKGEFLGLIDALKAAPPGSPEFEFIRGRINRLSGPESGFSVEVGADGSVSVSQGGETGAVPNKMLLGGPQLDELRAAQSAIDFGTKAIDALLGEIEKDPSKFGAVGTVRRGVESVKGIAEDVAKTGLSVLGIDAGQLSGWIDNVIQFEREAGTPENVIGVLKPTTTRASDVYAQALTYSLARALQPEGRLLASTIEQANDMVKITGARGSRQVAEQLQAIKSILQTQGADLQRRMEQGVTGTATTPRVAPEISPPAEKGGSSPRTDQPAKKENDWLTIDGVKIRRK